MTPYPQISLIFWHFYLKTVQRPSETPGVPYTPMNDRTKQLEMTDADFLGHAPEKLACNQCGGAFCGLRVGRVYQGKPLRIMTFGFSCISAPVVTVTSNLIVVESMTASTISNASGNIPRSSPTRDETCLKHSECKHKQSSTPQKHSPCTKLK